MQRVVRAHVHGGAGPGGLEVWERQIREVVVAVVEGQGDRVWRLGAAPELRQAVPERPDRDLPLPQAGQSTLESLPTHEQLGPPLMLVGLSDPVVGEDQQPPVDAPAGEGEQADGPSDAKQQTLQAERRHGIIVNRRKIRGNERRHRPRTACGAAPPLR